MTETRSGLRVLTDPAEWSDLLESRRQEGARIGLVPTMGALHAGHQSLIRRARADCDVGAVTDYVNPLQFDAGEDLEGYPRDLDRDCEQAAAVGADVMFAPSPAELWPQPRVVSVRVTGPLTAHMEAEARPGHFDGVTTIVAKLRALGGRSFVYFGEKDYQQLAVVRRLAADLSLPVFIVGCPTVRQTDGLALSSRNAYLTADERAVAPTLYWSLLAGKRAVEDDGERDAARIRAAMRAVLDGAAQFATDYVAVADPDDLHVPERVDGPVRLLAAARLGRARLIDNLAATPHPVDEDSAPDHGAGG
ncbi:MAG: pantoate--beta-alanine ligase [Actinomycetes bacterium]